jgi:hypothetical protein
MILFNPVKERREPEFLILIVDVPGERRPYHIRPANPDMIGNSLQAIDNPL